MNKQALSLAVFIAGAYPAASNALGLGDIESSSHLNQPLRATIDLLAVAPADASQIQVRLASPDVFNRVGVARPDFLGNLNFTPSVQGGKPVILVTSDVPMQEPFVNFLLEVSWPQGQLLKEYTVMLDPPVLMQPGNTVAGDATVRAEPKAAGTVRRPAQQQQASQGAQPAARQAATAQQASNRTYRVKPGDTLFRVASRLQQSGVSNDQMMMALFRANPNAFIGGNINNLRSGVEVKAPAANEASSVSRAEARREIRQQNAAWRELRKTLAKNTVPQKATGAADKPATTAQAPAKPADNNAAANNVAKTPDKARLEVLGAKAGQTTDSKAAVAAGNAKLTELEKELSLARESLTARQNENNELKSRISDLEALMGKKDRLISLRDEQLAGLQKQLTDKGVAVPPVTGSETTTDNAASKPAQQAATPQTTPPDQGKDIQTHVANVTGQGNDAVLRGEQKPATTTPDAPNQAVPAQPTTPAQPATPANQATPAQSATPANQVTPAAQGTEQQAAVPDRPTPAGLAMGGRSSIPLTPPVETKPAEQNNTTVVPVSPVTGGDANNKPPKVFADQSEGNDDLLSLLTSPLALQIGAGSLALLLLLWLLGRRRKPAGRADYKASGLRDEPDVGTDNFHAADSFDLGALENELDKAETRGEKFDDHHGHDAADPFGVAGGAWDDVSDSKSVSGDGQEEDDLLTEANVYIAYGLYQQAESELKKGIERHPERLEYRHKLLECYFVANNREAFDRQASQFAGLEGNNKSALWKAIAEWGRKISPDNALYQENGLGKVGGVAATVAAALGGVAAATASVAAVASHDDTTSVKPQDKPVSVTDDFELDLDRALGELDMEAKPVAVESMASADDEFADLDLGDLDFDGLDLDKLLQDDERPSRDVPATPAVAATAFDDELPDLSDFDEPVQKTTPQPVVAAVDDDFELDLTDLDLELGLEDKQPEPVASFGIVPTIADGDNLLDFVTDEPVKPAPIAAAVMEPDVPVAKAAGHVANLNLHLDNASGINRILPKDTFYAPAESADGDWLGDIDDALSFLDFPDEEIDLHEAHISTKLDLARAYLDMGDIEGARSTLEEVMVEGNDDQRREAEVLLHQTG